MKKRYTCDRCENGQIREYGHVDNGVCWKCHGVGTLAYDPQIHGVDVADDMSYHEFMQEQRYAEEAQKAQSEAWRAVNNMFDDPEENYYHG